MATPRLTCGSPTTAVMLIIKGFKTADNRRRATFLPDLIIIRAEKEPCRAFDALAQKLLNTQDEVCFKD